MASKINEIEEMLKGITESDEIIGFGFFCDVSEQPYKLKGYAMGVKAMIVEGLAQLLKDEQMADLVTKAMAFKLSEKLKDLKNAN